MAKDVINVDGKDVVVREDIAKGFRGVNWAIASIAIMVIITGILFFVFFVGSAKDGTIETPRQASNANTR